MAKFLNIDGSIYDKTFSQILDNVEYIFHIYYNKRSGWHLSVYDSDLYDSTATDNTSALILGGRKLMPSQDVFKVVSDSRLPKGKLYCVDTDLKSLSEQEQLTIGNFGVGNRYRLVYFSEEDLTEFSQE